MSQGHDDSLDAAKAAGKRRLIYIWVAVAISATLALAAGALAFLVSCIDKYPHTLDLDKASITGVITTAVCFVVLMFLSLLPLYWPPKR